jgi:serine phosphatase RsbU (regulator of sigma subunit)
MVTPSYFATMRIPLLAGRYLTDHDEHHEPPGTMSMVLNQTAARTYWKSRDPVGSIITLFGFGKARFRVVGVVGDTHNAGLAREIRPEMYVSYRESPADHMSWVVRSPLDSSTINAELRQAVMSVDADQPLYGVETMDTILDESLGQPRLQSFMVSFFAAAAVLLSMLGVYGVVSYAVRQRTTEIGTRMAVGATSRDLMRLVIGDGLKMAGVGIAAGMVAAVAVFAITPALKFDGNLWPFLIPVAALALLTTLACFFPAWRATLVSPLIAIRNEPGSLWQQTRWGFLRAAERIGSLASRIADDQPASSESELLAEIADVGRRANSFGEAMQAALALVRERIQAESLALLVQKQAGQPYRCAAIVPDSCGDQWTLPADALVVGRLRYYAGALPVNAGDLDAAARWSRQELPEIAVMRDLGVALAVRVAVKNETSGVLFAGRAVGRSTYSSLDKRLLRGVAAQLAMMIENSRLTDRIVEQERLRRELMLASEVQKRLFPENSPATASLQLAGICVPARGVGGDYYDFLDLGGHRMGIALADVAGKGIAAALIMSVVQASMRSLAGAEGVSLAELASKMNRLLHRSTGSNSYATFFYAQVDEHTRQMRYVNAGHNPPFLLRNGETHSAIPFVASTAPIEELSTGGTIIGMFAQSSYEEAILDLHSGDILLAFTDGVTEALNPQDEEFGEDRLKEALRAAAYLPVNEMGARILQQLKTWIADAAQYDDLTFIVMKVN